MDSLNVCEATMNHEVPVETNEEVPTDIIIDERIADFQCVNISEEGLPSLLSGQKSNITKKRQGVLCLACHGPSKRLQSIYERILGSGEGPESEDICYADMFTYCTNIEIDGDETRAINLQICKYCSEKLIAFYYFKRMCVRTNESFLENPFSSNCPICPEKFATTKELDDHGLIHVAVIEDVFEDDVKPTVQVDIPIFEYVAPSNEIDVDPLDVAKHSVEEATPEEDDTLVEQKVVEKLNIIRSAIYRTDSYKCTTCPKKFQSLLHWQTHTSLHNSRDRECPACRKCFPKITALIEHVNLSHSLWKPTQEDIDEYRAARSNPAAKKELDSDISRLCAICGKLFMEKGLFKTHMMWHEGVKNYKCSLCEAAFISKSSLNVHMTTHSDLRPHECDLCPKAFKTASKLITHKISAHNMGEKRHECQFCSKRFVEKGKLKLHLLVHTGEQPHVCVECGRAFSQKKNLNTHMRIHTGEKPYVCEFCGERYRQQAGLDQHRKKVHSELMTLD